MHLQGVLFLIHPEGTPYTGLNALVSVVIFPPHPTIHKSEIVSCSLNLTTRPAMQCNARFALSGSVKYEKKEEILSLHHYFYLLYI